MAGQEQRSDSFDVPCAQATGPSQTLPNEKYYRTHPEIYRARNAARLGIALLLIGLLWLAVELLLQNLLAGHSSGDKPFTEQTLSGNQIELDVGNSNVEMHGWNNPGIKVEARYQGGSPDNYTVNVTQFGDTVHVTGSAKPCVFCSHHLSYHVMLPSGARANVHTTSGGIHISESSGDVLLTTAGGDVTVDDITGNVRVNTSSGNVSLHTVRGQLNVLTTSGDVKLEDGKVNSAEIQTTSGDIELQRVTNVLKLSSISGGISVKDARDGQIEASTASGNINYDGSLANGGKSSINSISGAVTLHLPQKSSLRLNVSTVSGSLSNNIGLRDEQSIHDALNGAAGNDTGVLTIETTSGNITIDAR